MTVVCALHSVQYRSYMCSLQLPGCEGVLVLIVKALQIECMSHHLLKGSTCNPSASLSDCLNWILTCTLASPADLSCRLSGYRNRSLKYDTFGELSLSLNDCTSWYIWQLSAILTQHAQHTNSSVDSVKAAPTGNSEEVSLLPLGSEVAFLISTNNLPGTTLNFCTIVISTVTVVILSYFELRIVTEAFIDHFIGQAAASFDQSEFSRETSLEGVVIFEGSVWSGIGFVHGIEHWAH